MDYSVFGLENPLFDRIASVDDEVLEATGAARGTMNLVDYEQMRRVLALAGEHKSIPGGSAANTIRAIACLAREAPIPPPVYSGAVGNDPAGELYAEILRAAGIETRLVCKSLPTGCSVILVTPDRERTMFTFLGACRQYGPEDLDLATLERSRFLYMTGYMWDTENQKRAALLAAATARRAGVRIAFDLADPFAVRRYRGEFLQWLPGNVDVLFGNREEYRLMFGEALSEEELSRRAGSFAEQAVLKVGAEGCLVNDRGLIHRVAGFPAQPVDTTAAGDCFAAGYLYGLLKGCDAKRCARIANRLAAWIVTVEGCDLTGLDPRATVREAR